MYVQLKYALTQWATKSAIFIIVRIRFSVTLLVGGYAHVFVLQGPREDSVVVVRGT